MKTTGKIPKDVATQANNVNIFDEKMEIDKDKVTVEIKVTGTDAATKATLMISASGENFSQPHDDAVIEIPAGDQVKNVPFEGLTPGIYVEVYFDKQTASSGTFEAFLK